MVARTTLMHILLTGVVRSVLVLGECVFGKVISQRKMKLE